MATAIAEKSETMISLGIINSRLKDFYDIWLLSELFEHQYSDLRNVIKNTFSRRNVPMPVEFPEAWSVDFAHNPTKMTQWNAFLRKNNMLSAPREFSVVVSRIALFLYPVFFPPENPPCRWMPGKNWA